VPIPPLAEQKQIAAKLDELLAQVDTLKTRLDAIPAILKRFRQSVLAAAVSGRLTEEWRDEHEQGAWRPVRFEEVIEQSGNGISKRRGAGGEDVTVLRLADFKDAKRVFGGERKINLSQAEQEKYRLNNGDLLTIRVNGSVDLAGLFILYEEGLDESYCDHFIRFTLNLNDILPKYFTFVSNEGVGRRYLKDSLSTSAGQNTINQKSIKGLRFDLPTIEEQTEIVHRVEQLFSFADHIEQRLKAAQSRVNHLTQSILAKAFRGELTAEWREQNPDLISGEHSAAALLARIKAENERLKPVKRKRGARK
jgi:type I restriction enzyme S subunit